MDRIRVVLAFKREIFREGLARLLGERAPHLEISARCSTGKECIQKAKELKPDVILLDTEIIECNCVEVTQTIKSLLPEIRILILTLSEEDTDLFSTIKAGASAYISEDTGVEDLIIDVKRVYNGEIIISPPMAGKMLREFRFFGENKEAGPEKYDTVLSKREMEVLALVAKGDSNREIAKSLFISENTVKVHLSRILEKLHVNNRQQAAILAIEKGIPLRPTSRESRE